MVLKMKPGVIFTLGEDSWNLTGKGLHEALQLEALSNYA